MDTTPPRPNESDVEYHGYCHHCDSEKLIKTGVYTCPTCNSEFVEIIEEEDQLADENDTLEDELSEEHSMMSSILEESSIEDETTTDSDSLDQYDTSGTMRNQINRLINHLLQRIIPSVNSNNDLSQVLQVRPINLEEWANRLEEFEQTLGGNPPLPQNKIEEMPTSLISQDHLDMNLQCSICWEEFVINETIIKLVCGHIFHKDCIIPWLRLRSTCPVCRKRLGDGNVWRSNSTNRSSVDPNLSPETRVHGSTINVNHGSIVHIDVRHSPVVPLSTTHATRTSEVPSTISSSNLQTQGNEVRVTHEPIPMSAPATVHINFHRSPIPFSTTHATRTSEVPSTISSSILQTHGTEVHATHEPIPMSTRATVYINLRHSPVVPFYTTHATRTSEVPSTISSSNLQTHGTEVHATHEPIPMSAPATVHINLRRNPIVPFSTTHAPRTSEVPSTISSSNLQTRGTEVHVTHEPIPMSTPAIFSGSRGTQVLATYGTRSEVPIAIDPSTVRFLLETLHNRLIQAHETLVSRSSSLHAIASTAIACDLVSDLLPPGHESVMNMNNHESVNNMDDRESVMNMVDQESVMNMDNRESVMNMDDQESVINMDNRESVMNVDDQESVMNMDDRESDMNMDGRESVMNMDDNESYGCDSDPSSAKTDYELYETDDSDEDMDHDHVINI